MNVSPTAMPSRGRRSPPWALEGTAVGELGLADAASDDAEEVDVLGIVADRLMDIDDRVGGGDAVDRGHSLGVGRGWG